MSRSIYGTFFSGVGLSFVLFDIWDFLSGQEGPVYCCFLGVGCWSVGGAAVGGDDEKESRHSVGLCFGGKKLAFCFAVYVWMYVFVFSSHHRYNLFLSFQT